MLKPGERILLTGATGTVGQGVARKLMDARYEVRALSRSRDSAIARLGSGCEVCTWDGVRATPDLVADTQAVVHLAGEPIFGGPLTRARREKAYASRIDSTRSLVTSLESLASERRPRTLVCASAVGFYGSHGDAELTEESDPGEGFLADLCRDWEREAARATQWGVRVVSLRIGVVLSRDGGALIPLARLFRLGLGGRLGDGQQWFPWIHVDDLIRLIVAALEDDRFEGGINAVAPNPVRNRDFTRSLASAVGRPAFFHVPAFVLRTALGELSGELLGSRRAIPRAATENGFSFVYPTVDAALADAL